MPLPSNSVGSLLAFVSSPQPLAVQQISNLWNQSAGLPSENCFGTLTADGVVIVLTILCYQCNWIVADTKQYHNRLNTTITIIWLQKQCTLIYCVLI